ncbi:MAG: hypothetical protein K6A33_05600 [Clostridiales bacterium]|nr:hypothetical protein [Clostridiales bacterium]
MTDHFVSSISSKPGAAIREANLFFMDPSSRHLRFCFTAIRSLSWYAKTGTLCATADAPVVSFCLLKAYYITSAKRMQEPGKKRLPRLEGGSLWGRIPIVYSAFA